jgi:hypothetical protein
MVLERFLADKSKHQYELPPSLRVAFNSPGGSVIGGMKLGRLLRKLDAETFVGSKYEKVVKAAEPEVTFVSAPVCASACTLAFAGGGVRVIEDGAKFGLHQFSSTKGDMGEGKAQVAVVVLASYLKEMGVDRRMLDVASVVDHTGIFWLAAEDARALDIDNTTPPLAPWTIKATAQGTPYITAVQRQPAGGTVQVAFMVDGRAPFVVVKLYVPKNSNTRTAPERFPLGQQPELVFRVDDVRVAARSIEAWQMSETADEYVFDAIGALSPAQLQRIGNARKLRLESDAFSHSIGDLSPATDLSTRELSSGLALLLRSS